MLEGISGGHGVQHHCWRMTTIQGLFSGQLCHPHSKKVFPTVHVESLVFQFVSTVSLKVVQKCILNSSLESDFFFFFLKKIRFFSYPSLTRASERCLEGRFWWKKNMKSNFNSSRLWISITYIVENLTMMNTGNMDFWGLYQIHCFQICCLTIRQEATGCVL